MLMPARWSFAQLDEWRRYLTARVLVGAMPPQVDVDEVRNRVVFEVPDIDVAGAIRSRLGELNIQCGLVDVRVSAPRPGGREPSA